MDPENFRIPSAKGDVQLNCYRWIPEGEPRAVMQITHGMVEHILRYSHFAEFLADNGIAVYGHDHRGHGGTSPDDLGFIADKRGDIELVEDLHQLSLRIRESHPDIPLIVLGHSMGSFVTRLLLTTHGEVLDGAIVMGTGNQPASTVKMGVLISKLVCLFRGKRHVSPFLRKMVLGGNDKKVNASKGSNMWLTTDEEQLRKYNEDPLCDFGFTAAAYRDLLTMIKRLVTEDGFDNLPKDVPVLFVSGADDAVGEFGKGVRRAEEALRSRGMETSVILYEGARHEILNERTRDKVYSDILGWIGTHWS